MNTKKLVFIFALVAVFLCWAAPTAVLAEYDEDNAIELPEDENDHPPFDPDGLSADPQTFDVEVWTGPVIKQGDSPTEGGFWAQFLSALQEMLSRMWIVSAIQ